MVRYLFIILCRCDILYCFWTTTKPILLAFAISPFPLALSFSLPLSVSAQFRSTMFRIINRRFGCWVPFYIVLKTEKNGTETSCKKTDSYLFSHFDELEQEINKCSVGRPIGSKTGHLIYSHCVGYASIFHSSVLVHSVSDECNVQQTASLALTCWCIWWWPQYRISWFSFPCYIGFRRALFWPHSIYTLCIVFVFGRVIKKSTDKAAIDIDRYGNKHVVNRYMKRFKGKWKEMGMKRMENYL